MIDSAVHLLPAWQRGLIARAGRLILVKNVMSAKPVHHLLVLEPPEWVLEELNKWFRGFFWAGKKQVNGGQCLVAWDAVCRPTCYGGLGIKDLRLQGMALRVRWAWLKRVDQNRPWQGLPMCKDIVAEGVFQSLCKFRVGDGELVLFWKDRWVNGEKVSDIAPLVSAAVSTRCKNSRKVKDAMQEDSWMLDVVEELTAEGAVQLVRLWLLLARVQRDASVPDEFEWSCAKKGKYNAKDTYNRLCQGSIQISRPQIRSNLGDAGGYLAGLEYIGTGGDQC